MKYRNLAQTGLMVSQVCLGTMTFGDQLAERDAVEAVSFAVDQGVNFVDTADIYFRGSCGTSEQVLGKAIRPYRDKIVLATKCGGAMSGNINDKGLGRRHVISAVEGSLRRMGTDYVDLLYYHFPDPNTDTESLIFTANELIQAGKIRYYGLSNFPAWQTCELYLAAKAMNLVPPVVTESVYNLLTRGVEDEMIPMLKKHPMAMVVYNPLAGGLLTGKHKRNAPAPDSRFAREKGYADRYFQENNLEAVDKLQEIARESGYSMIEMSLKWLLETGSVTSVILGFSRLEQLRQNLELLDKKSESPLPLEKIDLVWKELLGNRFSYHQ